MSRAVIESFHWLYGTFLLKPHIGHIDIIQFRQKEPSRYRAALTVAAWPAIVLKKAWSDDAFCPKSAPNSDALWVLITGGFSKLQTRQFWRLTKPSRWKCVSFLSPSFHYFYNIVSIMKTCCCINPKLSNSSFFRIANNLTQKWRQILR